MNAPVPSVGRRAALTVLGASIVVGVSGCVAPVSLDGPPAAESPAPVPSWITLRFEEADRGRTIRVDRGESFAVSLRVPSAAGIGWTVTRLPAGLRSTGRFTGPVGSPGGPTSPVTPTPLWQVFVFEAREPVEDELVIERSGPDGERPGRFVLRIVVPPA